MLGYNSSLAVHSLMDGEDRVLLYVASHTVVIHDILGNRQYHLQVWHTARASVSLLLLPNSLPPSFFPGAHSWSGPWSLPQLPSSYAMWVFHIFVI